MGTLLRTQYLSRSPSDSMVPPRDFEPLLAAPGRSKPADISSDVASFRLPAPQRAQQLSCAILTGADLAQCAWY